ncbi:DNA-directed RNA polymerase III 47 kDa polypeptide [Nocardioides sp. AX2bis]|nr:DNA-directed RNA polymerase III 47 kDa polypeptide [Nocardioides sp. AX2bis]
MPGLDARRGAVRRGRRVRGRPRAAAACRRQEVRRRLRLTLRVTLRLTLAPGRGSEVLEDRGRHGAERHDQEHGHGLLRVGRPALPGAAGAGGGARGAGGAALWSGHAVLRDG